MSLPGPGSQSPGQAGTGPEWGLSSLHCGTGGHRTGSGPAVAVWLACRGRAGAANGPSPRPLGAPEHRGPGGGPEPVPARASPRPAHTEPIQSRCAVLRYTKLTDAQVLARLLRVIEKEAVPYTDDGLEAIIFTAQGDMRQVCCSPGGPQSPGGAERSRAKPGYHLHSGCLSLCRR